MKCSGELWLTTENEQNRLPDMANLQGSLGLWILTHPPQAGRTGTYVSPWERSRHRPHSLRGAVRAPSFHGVSTQLFMNETSSANSLDMIAHATYPLSFRTTHIEKHLRDLGFHLGFQFTAEKQT